MSKSVSYSQYSMFRQCPHQWYLTYVKGNREFKPGINLTFGTSFHETLQNYLGVMFEDSLKKADEIDLGNYLKQRLVENYTSTAKGNHFSSPEELSEFHADGVAILDFFKKRRAEYFGRKNNKLIGIEVPINAKASPDIENVEIKGFIDLVIYNENSERYTIYDIKTSTRGWSDKEKKDQTKINQILLYKRFFSLLRNIPEDSIDVMFFIVRRKVPEVSEYPIKRIQEFIPANGTKKVKDAYVDFTEFVNEVFTKDGEYIEQEYKKCPTRLCDWCQFNDKAELCDKKSN
jgi:hypothetical protein